MEVGAEVSSRGLIVLKWTARIFGTLLVILLFFLFLSNMLSNGGQLDTTLPQLATMIFFFLAQIGILLAWRWEGAGGFLALIGIVVSSLVQIFWESPRAGIAFSIWLIPAVMFIIYWWRTKKLMLMK